MVRPQHFHCHDPSSVPGWGTEISQAAQHTQKKKRPPPHKNPLTIVPGWNCSFPERTCKGPWGQDRLFFILEVLESLGLMKPPRSSRTEPRMDHSRVSCPPVTGPTLPLAATSRTETSPVVTSFVWAGIWAHSFYPSGLVLISGPPEKSLGPFTQEPPSPSRTHQ